MVHLDNGLRRKAVAGRTLLVAIVLLVPLGVWSFDAWSAQGFTFYVVYHDRSEPVNGTGVMDWRREDGSEERGRVQVTIVNGVGETRLPVAREKLAVTGVRFTSVETDRGPGLGGGWRRLTDVNRHVRLEIRAGTAKPREWFARALERSRAVVDAGPWSGEVLTDADRELIRDAIVQLRSETADQLSAPDLVALLLAAAQVNHLDRVGFDHSVFREACRRCDTSTRLRLARASHFLSGAQVYSDDGPGLFGGCDPGIGPAADAVLRWRKRQFTARLTFGDRDTEDVLQQLAKASDHPGAQAWALRRARLRGTQWSPAELRTLMRLYVEGRSSRQVSSQTRYGDEELAPIVHDLQFELAEAAMPAIRKLDDEALLADAERDRRLLRVLGPVINIGAVARAARVDLRSVTVADYRTSTNVSLWRALEALAVSGELDWLDLIDEVANGR